MNLSYSAFTYEARRGQTAMARRLVLRFFALWIAIWAASDLFFIWFRTGRLGSAQHEYFGRWILAWFFTQKLPLAFLSLPYRSGRYTIGSMYLFLNQRFYLGHSFGEWFAFNSLWAAFPASISVVAVTYLLVRGSEKNDEGEHLRGLRLITPRRLSRQLRRSTLRSDKPGIELARVRLPLDGVRTLPYHRRNRSGKVDGDSFAARTNPIEPGPRDIVDPECEYVSEFYRPVRGDLILNPVDERCPWWSPWLELSEGYYQAAAATLAASLIPEPPRGYESGSDHFFRQSSRTLLESLLQVAVSREPQSIPKLLELSRDQLKTALSGTPAFSLMTPERMSRAPASSQRSPTRPDRSFICHRPMDARRGALAIGLSFPKDGCS